MGQQSDAILEAQEPGYTVHVMGPPEDGDGFLCTSLPPGELPPVVFHERPVELAGYWLCELCGHTDGPEA